MYVENTLLNIAHTAYNVNTANSKQRGHLSLLFKISLDKRVELKTVWDRMGTVRFHTVPNAHTVSHGPYGGPMRSQFLGYLR